MDHRGFEPMRVWFSDRLFFGWQALTKHFSSGELSIEVRGMRDVVFLLSLDWNGWCGSRVVCIESWSLLGPHPLML